MSLKSDFFFICSIRASMSFFAKAGVAKSGKMQKNLIIFFMLLLDVIFNHRLFHAWVFPVALLFQVDEPLCLVHFVP